jgi:flagellin
VFGSAGNTSVSAGGVTNLTAITNGSLAITVAGMAYSLGDIAVARTGQERLGQVVEAINRRTADSGVSAFLKVNTDGSYALSIRSGNLDATGSAVAVAGVGFAAATTGFATGDFTIANSSATSNVGIDKLNIDTVEGAWLAMKSIDDALNQINGARATLGAVQSRFENAVSNIMIQSENTAAARGRIMDADFAAETAALSRAQILQQAGTAMVAQANQLPQQVLSLLQG